MPELILRFETIKKKGADFDVPVPVSVKYGDKDVEQFKFNNPLTDKDLAEIRWYLEQYWYWPSDIDQERARKVKGKLPEWGKALFDAIFQKASDAMRLFSDFDHAGGERVLTIDTNEPRILRLPWELLRDEGGYLFSKKPPVSIRRHMHKTAGKPIQPFDLPARILMVTCRPDGAGFIDPRSIATPLLDSLDAIPEQVEVEFLRPPTLRALDDRLPRPPRVPLENLLTFLKGHPLSLQLALPQLRDYSAGQLVEQYQSILPHMKKGKAKERNESLEVSLRFSLDRLGADALNWLSRLWIFEGGALEPALLMITEIPAETWNSRATEIWDELEQGVLDNAANLNEENQVASISHWLCNL